SWGNTLLIPPPPYTFKEAVIRDSIIGHVDGRVDITATPGYQRPVGLSLFACKNAIVEGNIVKISDSRSLHHPECVSLATGYNITPSGVRVPVYDRDQEPNTAHDELPTKAEDALLLSL